MRQGALAIVVIICGLAVRAVAQAPDGGQETTEWKRAYLLSRAGDALYRQKIDEAEKLYHAVLKVGPTDETALMNLAFIAHKKNNHEGAIPYLRTAASSHPKSFAPNNELGNWLLALKKPDEAVDYLRKAADLKPDAIETRVALGDALSITNRKEEAMTAYREALKVDPKSPIAHRQLGYVLYDKKEFPEAFTHLELAATTFPNDENVLLVAGHCQNELGNDATAALWYRKTITANPRSAVAHMFLGNTFDRQGQLTEAEREYLKSLELNPREALPQVHLGNLYRKRNDLKKAKQAYERALALQPQFVWGLVQLGYLLLDEKQPELAQKYLKQAYALAPDNPDVGTTLGDLALSKNRLDEAEKMYRTVLTGHALHLGARVKLGDVLMQRGKLEQAKQEFIKAARNNPRSAWALIRLGDCEHELKQYEIAEKHFRQALERDPSSSWARRELAFTLTDLQKDDEAFALFSNLTGLESDADSQLAIGHLHFRAERWAQALWRYSRAADLAPKNGSAFMFRGIVQQKLNMLDSAFESLTQALTVNENLSDAWVLKGDTARLIALKKAQADVPKKEEVDSLNTVARRSYERALVIKPQHTWPKRQLGLLAYELGDNTIADTMLADALPDFPNDAEISLTIGRVAFDKKDDQLALKWFEKAIEQRRSDVRPYVFTARVHRRQRAPLEAVAVLEKGLEQQPRDAIAHLEMAQTQGDLRKWKVAHHHALQSTQLAPKLSDAWLFLGQVEQKLMRFDEAVRAYERASQLKPGDAVVERAMASALLSRRKKGDLDDGADLMKRPLQQLDNEVYTHLVAGHIDVQRALAAKKNTELKEAERIAKHAFYREKAEPELRRAMKMQPEELGTILFVAQGFYDLDNFDEASEVLALVIRKQDYLCPTTELALTWTDPDATQPKAETLAEVADLDTRQLFALAHLMLGNIRMRAGAEPQARLEYACSIAIYANNADAHAQLGYAYELARLMRLAEEHYLAALAIDPENNDAKQGVERLRREGGFPLWKVRVAADVGFISDPLSPELLGRIIKTYPAEVNIEDPAIARQLNGIPRIMRLSAGVSYAPPIWKDYVRFNLDYAFLRGWNMYLADIPPSVLDGTSIRLPFEHSVGHALSLVGLWRIPQLRDRRAELALWANYRLFLNRAPSRFENRHLITGAGRLVHAVWGRIEALVGYEFAGFSPTRVGQTLNDQTSNSMMFEASFMPSVRRYNLDGMLQYRVNFFALAPSARWLWQHVITAEGTHTRGPWYFGPTLRFAVGSETNDSPTIPDPTIISLGAFARVGYVFDGYTSVNGTFGWENAFNAPQLNAFRLGASGTYRLFWPKTKPQYSGLSFSLSAELRWRYNIGGFDPIITANIGFAR